MENNSKQSKQCKTKTEPKHNIRKQQKKHVPPAQKKQQIVGFLWLTVLPPQMRKNHSWSALLWSRGHPRTQIQVTCTHRDLFRALRSPAHASDSHMYTPARPTVTCTHRCGHLRTQVTVTCTHMWSSPAVTCTHHYSGDGVGWQRSCFCARTGTATLSFFLLFSRHRHYSFMIRYWWGWVGWGGVVTFMSLCTHRHSNLIIFLAAQQTQALLIPAFHWTIVYIFFLYLNFPPLCATKLLSPF